MQTIFDGRGTRGIWDGWTGWTGARLQAVKRSSGQAVKRLTIKLAYCAFHVGPRRDDSGRWRQAIKQVFAVPTRGDPGVQEEHHAPVIARADQATEPLLEPQRRVRK